jgi:hypothetical protein
MPDIETMAQNVGHTYAKECTGWQTLAGERVHHSDACRDITTSVRSALNAALDLAAKAADDQSALSRANVEKHKGAPFATLYAEGCVQAAEQIGDAIRALKAAP